VAASGTHDTEPLAVWWAGACDTERRMIAELPTVQRITGGAKLADSAYVPAVRDALLESLFASGSNLVLNPIGDAFGWRDRINDPAVVSDANWTFRLPWPSDHLAEIPEARERQETLRAWANRHNRLT
jgi:4-alpha-glucanotransferase